MLTSPAPEHPAPFSPEVLELVELAVTNAPHVHDPWAGLGRRLAEVCDRHGVQFTGIDVEAWPGADERVALGDSADATTYPAGDFLVVTSPVYLNRISTDYVNGPTPATKTNGRRAYGVSLGRALDERNLARACRQPERYYEAHARAVKHWGPAAIVNVDLPMAAGWRELLEAEGFVIGLELEAHTRRYRGPANSDKRAPHEVVIVATRSSS